MLLLSAVNAHDICRPPAPALQVTPAEDQAFAIGPGKLAMAAASGDLQHTPEAAEVRERPLAGSLVGSVVAGSAQAHLPWCDVREVHAIEEQ